ncbi:hypothetical protein DL89DRAFT_269323 [Linderina pennispora]|uniref:Xrn1 N-terminal domain-containing protein n=1 Tax=Linderina pennispora TaxID=61395 RepID=A0A1Y1W2M0_9FUNG|nr:uncharacterized protein DL89DRAFT_269323 [Linderina pennispora]ORX67525.1 hypothetical protein DL89DRAFT_269323 [Linderina pennispora]
MDDKWRQVKVVLSGYRDPGEGEQKIMRYLESTRDTRFQHCVWSNDADTVLLERTPNGVPTYTVVDIDELESQLVKRYAPTQEITGNIVRRQKFIDDLVFMSFLAGNDFLPPAVNMQTTDSDALDRLWRLYAGSPLVDMNIHDRGVINVDAFRILLDLLEVEYEQRDFRKHIGVMSLGSQLTALRIRRLAWDSQRHQLSNSESATATETEVLLEEVVEKRPRKKKRGKESKSERRARKAVKQKQDLPFASDTELEVKLLPEAAPLDEIFPVYVPLGECRSEPTLKYDGKPLLSPILLSATQFITDFAAKKPTMPVCEIIGYVNSGKLRWLQSMARAQGLEPKLVGPSDVEYEGMCRKWKLQRASKASDILLSTAMVVIGDIDYCPPSHILTLIHAEDTPASTTIALVSDNDWDILYADAKTEHRREQEHHEWRLRRYMQTYRTADAAFISHLCKHYALAVGWTAQYYFAQTVPSWHYAWPRDIESMGTAPMFSDFQLYIEAFAEVWSSVPRSDQPPPLPREHMLSVLPKEAWKLLDADEQQWAQMLAGQQYSESARKVVRARMENRLEDIACVRIWF